MDRRETQETIDVKSLTKRAISLYLKQAAGEEVDPEEIERLRQDARSFPDEKEFKDFRVAVGTTALQGKFTFERKDAGSSIMGLMFEEHDRQLYDAVVTLSRALQMAPRDYTITAMLNIYDELEERRKAGDVASLKKELEKSGYAPEELERAERVLKSFLFERAGASIREQLTLRQEAEREGRFIKEAESAFLSPRTSEKVREDLKTEEQSLQHLWDRLREAKFEEAPDFIQKVLNSRRLVEELKQELKAKSRKTKGKPIGAELQLSPEDAVARNWALALLRLAKINRLDAAEAKWPEDAVKLTERAQKYEVEAERLLARVTSSAEEDAK